MAKITVMLTAVMHDGKTVRQPGESVSMDEARAQKLAALGMAKLPKKAAKAKANGVGKSTGAAVPPPPQDSDDDDVPGGNDPDADGEGGEDNV